MSTPKVDVRLLPIAEDDLSEILAYGAADRQSAAEALLSKVEKNLDLLSQNPRMGRIPEEVELTRLNYRYLVIENYLLFYTLEGQTIYVHRILHGARNYLPLF